MAYPKNIASLTSLRFIAALAVLLYHYILELPADVVFAQRVFRKGYLGVDFFFVLSGFVLAHAYRSGFENDRFRARDFLVRRLARIYPMHLLTLLFYAILGFVVLRLEASVARPERYDPGFFFAHLFLVNGWMPVDHGTFNSPAWSVSAEWFAYLCFAAGGVWLFKTMARCGPLAATAGSFALLVVFYYVAPHLVGVRFTGIHSNFGFIRIMPAFLVGVSLYALGAGRRLPVIGSKWSILVLLLAVLAAIVARASDLTLIFLFAVIIVAGAEQARAGTSTVLNSRGLNALGDASYSLYLVHAPVGTVLFGLWERAIGPVNLTCILLALVASVGISLICYRWIEVPARDLIVRKLLSKGSPPRKAVYQVGGDST